MGFWSPADATETNAQQWLDGSGGRDLEQDIDASADWSSSRVKQPATYTPIGGRSAHVSVNSGLAANSGSRQVRPRMRGPTRADILRKTADQGQHGQADRDIFAQSPNFHAGGIAAGQEESDYSDADGGGGESSSEDEVS